VLTLAAILGVFALPASPALPARPALAAQIPFESAVRDLSSADPNVRYRAAQLLKEAAYPEAAVPLAALIADPIDDIQLEAIRAELNIFLAEQIVTKRRVALVVEKRTKIAAEAAFAAGPVALGADPVPADVLNALRAAIRDSNPDVAIEALYAFGTLAVDTAGRARRELLLGSAPELAAMLTGQSPAIRMAALRVLGRLFEGRASDTTVPESVGDAVIVALNDSDRALRAAATDAVGRMRYARAVQALTDLYQYYSRGEDADRALDALARIAHRSSVHFMTAALTTKTPTTKRIGIEGIARIGDRANAAIVQAALSRERDEAVLLAGSFAAARLANAKLDDLTSALARPRRREQAFGYLLELTRDPNPAVARAAEQAVAQLRATTRRAP
jgi:HEAT repeat protein